jgi:hypothetical protein
MRNSRAKQAFSFQQSAISKKRWERFEELRADG